jgi:hypothetical protein
MRNNTPSPESQQRKKESHKLEIAGRVVEIRLCPFDLLLEGVQNNFGHSFQHHSGTSSEFLRDVTLDDAW